MADKQARVPFTTSFPLRMPSMLLSPMLKSEVSRFISKENVNAE